VAAGAGEAVQQLAHGGVFPADDVQEELASAAFPSGCRQEVRREGLVQFDAVEVNGQQFAQDAESVFWLCQFIEFLPKCPGFGLG
jgi:hypothetical protein